MTSRPQPLLTRAGVVAAISGLVSLLVTVGVLPATLGSQLTNASEIVVAAVATILATVGPIVHALISRGVVTPIADPKNNAGESLVPASVVITPDVSEALVAAEAVFPSAVPSV